MKIRTKIAKLQMHENLHKNVNENKFHSHFYAIFREFLKRAIKATNMLQLYTANISYGFNPFRIVFQFFSASNFPKVKVKMLFLKFNRPLDQT